MQEEDPFKYDSKNKRIVTNTPDESKILIASAAIFGASLFFYHKKRFAMHGDLMKFARFGLLSVGASYGWGRFIFSDANLDAAIENNKKEEAHY
jgi:hypothetical protein